MIRVTPAQSRGRTSTPGVFSAIEILSAALRILDELTNDAENTAFMA